MPKKKKAMPPIHPGGTLREDFLKPLGLTANGLAMELIVPVTRVNDIVRGRRAITADTALRRLSFGRTFRPTTASNWQRMPGALGLPLGLVLSNAMGTRVTGW